MSFLNQQTKKELPLSNKHQLRLQKSTFQTLSIHVLLGRLYIHYSQNFKLITEQILFFSQCLSIYAALS